MFCSNWRYFVHIHSFQVTTWNKQLQLPSSNHNNDNNWLKHIQYFISTPLHAMNTIRSIVATVISFLTVISPQHNNNVTTTQSTTTYNGTTQHHTTVDHHFSHVLQRYVWKQSWLTSVDWWRCVGGGGSFRTLLFVVVGCVIVSGWRYVVYSWRNIVMWYWLLSFL